MSSKYERTVHFQASHFNDDGGYNLWREAHAERSFDKAVACMHLVHGHNFVCRIEGWQDEAAPQRFIFDDQEAEAIVMEWNDVNISVLPEFDGGLSDVRVSLERMCDRLIEKLRAAFPSVARWRVSINETPLIRAESEWTR